VLNQIKSIDIQLSFPNEPEYSEVPVDVLYELIESFQIEQSCATSAIYELHLRKDPKLKELCSWVLSQPEADEFLKDCAKEKGCV
jgi:hypothetical protein